LTELQIDPSGNTGMLDHYRQMSSGQYSLRDNPTTLPVPRGQISVTRASAGLGAREGLGR
jgi:hypothetical protein